ncbi:MAG: FecCD family ABC transporter permease [Candidatus Methanomethylophilaceae archaeon]
MGANIYDSEEEKVRKILLKRIIFIITLSVLVVLIFLYSITVGVSNISFNDVYRVFVNEIFPGTYDITGQMRMIVINLRLPRILMAVIGGAILALGGCLIQSVLRNPLATPYTLGVSSGAGLGAAIAILAGMTLASNIYGIILNAFIFALIPIGVILLASRIRNISPATMILCGVSMSYIFSAVNTLFQFFGDPDAVKRVVFWMIGDLNNIFIWHIPYVFVTLILSILISVFLSKPVNAMRLGDDTARSLGFNPGNTRTLAMLTACLSTAMVICFTGAIGFVCLLAPHICRVVVGGDMKYLIPSSMLCGSVLLLLADVGAKTLAEPIMLPVGAITALVGGPMLLYLLLRKRGNHHEI